MRSWSYAFDASEDGSVIVGQDGGAVVWRDGTVEPVADVLTAAGLDLSDWSLYRAVAVSDDGRTVTGHGRGPSGYGEAWVATLP